MNETKYIGKPLIRVKKQRAWELDFMRGVAVILMCFDHMMFDLSHPNGFFSNFYEVENSFAAWLYELARSYWGSTATFGLRFWGHYIFVFVFLFLVGTSCAFSRDNTRRGAICGLAALLFTGISYVLKAMGMMQYGIVFGILHCIALCILCVAAVDILTAWNKKVNLFAPLVLGIIILSVGISRQFWMMTYHYDHVFTDAHFTGYIMGTNAFGDDWFGLFPYVGMVFIGTFWGKAAYPDRKSLLPMLDGKWHKPVTFVGRRAIFFYFLHQPVIAGIIMLIGLCMGYTL